MKSIIQFSILALSLISIQLNGQQATLIADLNEGSASGGSSEENTSIIYDDKVYFSGNDGMHGFELMMYDGSTVSLIADINEGIGDSEIQNFYILGDELIFTADDGIHGMEFWVSDGTTMGTELLIDLSEGDNDGVYPGFGESSNSFELWDGYLYFNGRNRPSDNELWRTDGTPEGTTLVKNIGFDSGSFVTGSWPEDFVVYQDRLFFGSRDGFWATDGTSDGTVLVREDDPNDVFGFDPGNILATDFGIVMLQNWELWISDGTTNGTVRVKEFENIVLNWSGPRFRDMGDYVLFPANDGISGDELWRSDGTPEGTYLVKDMTPGSDGYAPQNTVVFNGKMYFKGSSEETGIELYETDGTEEGTQLVYEFNPGTSSGFFLPSTIFTDGNRLYLSAGKPFNQELWISDGTANGTYEVEISPSGESYPTNFLAFGDRVFFTARNSDTGRENYVFDATVNTKEITTKQINIYPNPVQNILYLKMELPQRHQVNIIDMQGRTVLTSNNASNGMNVNRLVNGQYTIFVTDDKNVTIGSTRFVKK
ncbi:MAG: T9SS type A sorting domain-containing protein [Bacteroidota bacterium]